MDAKQNICSYSLVLRLILMTLIMMFMFNDYTGKPSSRIVQHHSKYHDFGL